jgi:NNP family nitrate/nitrite transporter-like MFS transporter
MSQTDEPDCPMPETFRDKIQVTVFLAWLFYLGFVGRVMFAPLMPAIEKDMGISHSQAGTLFLLMSVGYLLAPFSSGLIASKIGHRGTLKLSAWAIGLALLPFAVVDRLWLIRLLLVMIGLAAGIHLPSAIATITAEVQKSDWGKALSVHQCAPPLSFVSAPIIAAVLLGWFSWRYVLALWGLLALVTALVYSRRGQGGAFPGQLPSPANVSAIVARPSFWIMVLLFAMAMGGNAGIYAMLPLYLVNERGFELSRANTLIGLSQISGVFMVFAAGWITDRIGQKPTMVAALLVTATLTFLLGVVHGAALVIVLFLQPAVLSSFFPAAFAALSRIAPPAMRSVVNALGPPLAFLLGGGVLPAIIGYMGETYTFSTGIIAFGIFMAVGPVLVFFLRLGQYDDLSGC